MSSKLDLALGDHRSTHVADLRKESLFAAVDVDNSGSLDRAEFEVLYEKIKKETEDEMKKELALEQENANTKKRAKFFCWLAGLLVVVVVLLLAGNTGLVYTLLEVTKEAHVKAPSTHADDRVDASEIPEMPTPDAAMPMLTDTNGAIVATREAEDNVPVFLAPRLPMQVLAQLKSLTLAKKDGMAHFKIAGFEWHHNFSMMLYTDCGADIVISGTDVKVVEANVKARHGQNANKFGWSACGGASASCSSIDVKGIDAPRLLDELYSEVDVMAGGGSSYRSGDLASYSAAQNESLAGEGRRLHKNHGHGRHCVRRRLEEDDPITGGKEMLPFDAGEGRRELQSSCTHGSWWWCCYCCPVVQDEVEVLVYSPDNTNPIDPGNANPFFDCCWDKATEEVGDYGSSSKVSGTPEAADWRQAWVDCQEETEGYEEPSCTFKACARASTAIAYAVRQG